MVDFEQLKQWIGRSQSDNGIVSAAPLAGLAATLDYAAPPWQAGIVAPLGYWLYLLPQARQGEIGDDGHPQRGGFLPPVPLPRRMWAGSRIVFHAPVTIGAQLERNSTVTGMEHKSGKSGDLVFVEVTHEWSTENRPLLTERQDIVYLEAAKGEVVTGGGTAPAAPRAADWRREIVPGPVLLFRFSALTFNSHRIHYDRTYCTDVEGYPGLVVHGPLTATLLMDLFVRNNPTARIAGFSFRGRRPLFDIDRFTLCGALRVGGADLWALDHQGNLAMTAEVELA